MPRRPNINKIWLETGEMPSVDRPDGPGNWISDYCDFTGSDAELRFAQIWAETYPEIDLYYQWRFTQERRLNLDFAHVESRTGIEIQGGTWAKDMGHSSSTGIRRDAKKIAYASEKGWLIIPVLSDQVEDIGVLKQIFSTIQIREEGRKIA